MLYLSVTLIFGVSTAFAQTGTIEGTITESSTGNVIIGANVYIQSLNRGAATDAQGKFSIEDVPYGTYKLRISYIGYATKNVSVTVDAKTVRVNQALSQDVAQLDEIVVTAFGRERQVNELSYSAQKVDAADVANSGSSDLVQSLSGKVAGLSVTSRNGMGGSSDIVLRGFSSLTGNNQVLFVVDGVPYANNRFNTAGGESGFKGYDFGSTALDINPANIASMTVLKGPAASALYGSRASNGAIIIETKKGAPAREPVNVTYSTSVGFSRVNPNTFPTYQKEYGSGYFPTFLKQPDVFTDAPNDSALVARYPDDASHGPAFDEDLMVYQWDSFYEGSPNYGQKTPWTPAENMPIEFFETGTNISNRLNVRGDINDGGGYYSLGYSQNNDRGILPNSSLKSHKLSFAGGYDVSDDFRVDASINYTRTNGKGRPARGYSTIMSEFRQWWAVNVDVEAQKDAYFRNRNNLTWNLTGDRAGPFYWNNPYFERYENYETDQRDRFQGYAQTSYDVFDWLTVEGQVSLDSYNQLIEERINKGSVGVSGYTKRTETFNEFNFEVLGNYDKELTERIDIDGVVGLNIRRNHVIGTSASTNGGLVTEGLFSLDNSENQILFPGETDRSLGVNSVFASFNFNYDEWLFLTLTGRRDKSSSLPEDNNVYYYPSTSASINFSQFVDAEWLSFGKIRGSWARVGNTAPPLSLQDVYVRNSNFGSAGLYTLPGTKNNSDLKPETTESIEAGLQLGFFNNRIYLDATAYKRNTMDQIFPVNISRATGYATKFLNSGNVENRGIDLTLRGRPVVTNDFSWSITANWNKNKSKVLELTDGVDYFEFAAPQGGVSIGAKEGEPYGVIRGSGFVYHENGEPIVGEDGYYLTSDASNKVIGNMLPDWRGSLSNTLNYKNWSLNVLLDVRWGGDIFSLDQWYGTATGLYEETAGLNARGNPKRDPVSEGGGIILDGVTEDGTPNDTYVTVNSVVGAYGYVFNPNEAYVYDGSYVKLREVGISYTLPQEFISSIGVLNSVSVGVTGRNLWIIHKNLPHGDPESTLTDGNVQGYQGGNLPSVRNVTFNLSVNF